MSLVRRLVFLNLVTVLAWMSVSLLPFGQQPTTPSEVQFVDIAQKAGLTEPTVNGGTKAKKYIFESTGSGVAAFDYNNDGNTDIFIVNGARLETIPAETAPTNHLYENQRDGTFADVTAKSGLAHSGWGQGVCVGDIDNDGNREILVTYYGQSNVLYRDNGKHRFDDVTALAGVGGGPKNWSSGCTFVDYDGDGFLDLFVAGYVELDLAKAPLPGDNKYCLWRGVAVFCGPRGLLAAKNYLYRNNRDGTFRDVSVKAGIRSTGPCYALSTIAADLRNIGRPDIYVACDSTPSLLFQNSGDGTFREIGTEAGVAFNPDGFVQAGMGVSVGDYDRDGWLDIFKTNFEDDIPDLFRNSGKTFSFQSYDAKLGFHLKALSWGGGFFDYDNDGWLDLFIANGHVYPEPELQGLGGGYKQRQLLYHNRRDGTFDDVTKMAGSGLELLRSGRGVAFADFDNDGDLDLVINNQNDPPTLLRNDGGN